MSKHSGMTQPPPGEAIISLYPQLTSEPRMVGIDAIRRAGGPHRALSNLVERLDRQADRLEDARDSGCVFARVLARMYHRLADALLRSGWDDPDWVALLAARTTEHYLNALRARHAGQPTQSVWDNLFEAAEKKQTSVAEELVLGLNAHFVHDLPHALVAVGMHNARGESRLRDYHAVNDPLALAIEDIQLELTRHYESWFAPADHVDQSVGGILSNEGLRVARACAWYNAERLQHEQLQGSARAAVRRWPLVTLYELLHPPVWSTRFASRRVRTLSRWARSWPGRKLGGR